MIPDYMLPPIPKASIDYANERDLLRIGPYPGPYEIYQAWMRSPDIERC